MDIRQGMRIRYPAHPEWGVGHVTDVRDKEWSSRHRFHVWPHHRRDSADLGVPPQFVHARAVPLSVVSQRLDGDIQADLVPVLEAVGHGLGRVVDSNLHAFDGASMPWRSAGPE